MLTSSGSCVTTYVGTGIRNDYYNQLINGQMPAWIAPLNYQQQDAAQQAQYNLVIRNQGPRKEQKPVRGAFDVLVINPESGEIVARETVVADSEDKARLKVLRKSDVDPDDVDIIVNRLGNVRPRKVVQEVRIQK